MFRNKNIKNLSSTIGMNWYCLIIALSSYIILTSTVGNQGFPYCIEMPPTFILTNENIPRFLYGNFKNNSVTTTENKEWADKQGYLWKFCIWEWGSLQRPTKVSIHSSGSSKVIKVIKQSERLRFLLNEYREKEDATIFRIPTTRGGNFILDKYNMCLTNQLEIRFCTVDEFKRYHWVFVPSNLSGPWAFGYGSGTTPKWPITTHKDHYDQDVYFLGRDRPSSLQEIRRKVHRGKNLFSRVNTEWLSNSSNAEQDSFLVHSVHPLEIAIFSKKYMTVCAFHEVRKVSNVKCFEWNPLTTPIDQLTWRREGNQMEMKMAGDHEIWKDWELHSPYGFEFRWGFKEGRDELELKVDKGFTSPIRVKKL